MSSTFTQRFRGLLQSFRHAPWQTVRRQLLSRGLLPPPPPSAGSSEYQQWLADRIAKRATEFTTRASPGQFSLLTGVYERTPTGVFLETVASVRSQTSQHFEWIILAHGPIPPELDSALNQLQSDSRIRIVRLPENLGIMGGMRRCLEEASGQFVIPLDADDLLTPDALMILASRLNESPAAFIYSDEDSLVDGTPRSPYFRPDWDPLLNLATSYIFHLVAFDRQVALDIGIYSDPAANYCHDWDSVFRFVGAGHTPSHVADVLYHWRAHAASHTNTTGPHQGSLQSQLHLLQQFLSQRADGHLFEIKPFPIFRGAQEWWLSRKRIEPANIDLLAPTDLHSLIRAVSSSSAPLTAIVNENVQPTDEEWRWEAQGLFALHPDMALLAGRIINPARIVLGGPDRVGPDGTISSPYRGMFSHEPGEMALALKPHTIDCPNSAFFVARTSFLQSALSRLPTEATLVFLGPWLARLARSDGQRVGFSPLVAADAKPGFDCMIQASPTERDAYLKLR